MGIQPSRRRHGRRNHSGYAGVAAYYYLNGAMWPSIASRIPAIAAHAHLGPRLLGYALLGQGLGLALMMLFSGRLVRRWGAGRVALISGILYSVATALPGWAPSAATLFASLVLWGATNAPLDAAQNVLANSLPEPGRGSNIVRLELAFSAGMLSGAGLGAAVSAAVSPRVQLTAVAVAGVLIALLAAPLLPRDGVSEEHSEQTWRPYLARHRRGRLRRAPGPTYRLKRRGYRSSFLRLVLLAILGVWFEAVIPDWSGLYLQHHLSAPPGQTGLGIVVFLAALSAVQIPAALGLPDRWRATSVALSGLTFAAGMAVATTSTTVLGALVGFGVCGAGAALIQPLAIESAMTVFGGTGPVVQRIQGPAYLGLALEKPVTGSLVGRFGYPRALQSTIPLAAVACVVALAAARTLNSSDSPETPDRPAGGEEAGKPEEHD